MESVKRGLVSPADVVNAQRLEAAPSDLDEGPIGSVVAHVSSKYDSAGRGERCECNFDLADGPHDFAVVENTRCISHSRRQERQVAVAHRRRLPEVTLLVNRA